MSKLIFKASEVRRVVDHSLKAPKQSPMFGSGGDPAPVPSIILVHDHGVYLMSNGDPRDLIDGKTCFAAYAKGCDPRTDEAHWETSRTLVGGDDFGETLPWAQVISTELTKDPLLSRVIIGFGKRNVSLSFDKVLVR